MSARSTSPIPGVAPRWIGLAAGLLVAVLDVVGARSLGLAFELNGRAVTGWVWLYLAVSFGGLGFLVGWLLELRRRERSASAEVLRQAEALDRARSSLAQSEKLAALGQLAASISHEVRNPLAILRTTIQNLEEDPGSTDDVRRSCAFLRDEIDRLGRVTGSILGFARPVAPRPGRVRAAELFERVKLLQPLEVREKSLRLDVRDASGAAEIGADADLLSQALLGLVTNAAQAARERGSITLEARSTGDEIALSVSDDGPGIPEADRERIFEPFYSTRRDGHGLGLAVVRQIARAHGARIEVDGNEGGGARFSIVFPARVAAPPVRKPIAPPVAAR
ncbi:MAG TPA: ATP-binding protein [Thermoanaerobaculia bacterium]|nr:ATP-binding protein [Thermoanaerobaculia bacterium]